MQSICLDLDASEGRSEEVAKAFYVSLNQIDTYWYDGERTILLGQTTDSGGGGVTEILAVELKNVGKFNFFFVSSTAACTPNLRHCIKVWNNYMVQVVLGRSLSFNHCTRFGRHRRHLVKTSKRHGLEKTQIPP